MLDRGTWKRLTASLQPSDIRVSVKEKKLVAQTYCQALTMMHHQPPTLSTPELDCGCGKKLGIGL
ncbi:MAG: hypothetical protein QW158_08125 [Nitrososphaerales archaeon]